ncbi:MAG: zeta toxin family protein [Alphaproteobacteria bacterium]|nr:zeta toxin family protein [Alphaproteobacteria bacterium]
MKEVLLIGGPNGAGKTTAAFEFLPKLKICEFVNADEIARGLNPLQPESQSVAAARLMLARIAQLTHQGKSFAFETTCAGAHHSKTLSACKAQGYHITLVFLWLSSPELAIERVEHRVKNGGHFIPPTTIRRRYQRGLHDFSNYLMPFADCAVIYDNSNNLIEKKIIAQKNPQHPLDVYDEAIWKKITG